MQRLRLIPIVLFATASLLALKAGGIVTSGGYILSGLADARAQSVPLPPPQPLDEASEPAPAPLPQLKPKRAWAKEMFGFGEVTGSISPAKPAEPAPQPPATAGKPAANATPQPTPIPAEDRQQMSPGERAVLERLQERRQELETRARELEIRDGLIKAAEKRLEARIYELKQLEKKIGVGPDAKGEEDSARLKSLVTMYESMKAKEAARIFNRLELRVLLDVASQINPRRMSEILAQMTPEAAERLTVELAARASNHGPRQPTPAELPKIEGRPRS